MGIGKPWRIIEGSGVLLRDMIAVSKCLRNLLELNIWPHLNKGGKKIKCRCIEAVVRWPSSVFEVFQLPWAQPLGCHFVLLVWHTSQALILPFCPGTVYMSRRQCLPPPPQPSLINFSVFFLSGWRFSSFEDFKRMIRSICIWFTVIRVGSVPHTACLRVCEGLVSVHKHHFSRMMPS